MSKQPLAEVFGFPITNEVERAERYRRDKLCPFNNTVSNCTKNSVDNPLGVCSVYQDEDPVIVCPVRFREDWKIVSDAAAFVLHGNHSWTHIGEVKLKDKSGKSAGNIDYVLVSYDENGQLVDFGSLEVQAVYISGNLSGPFEAFLQTPSNDFSWDRALKYPKPDYLSSSRKRLIPQIIAKGTILSQWGKKQAVAIQSTFYNTLPKLISVDADTADFAFFLYDLEFVDSEQVFKLNQSSVVYTKFEAVLEEIARFEAGPIGDFTKVLQKKLDKKRRGEAEPVDEDNLIVE